MHDFDLVRHRDSNIRLVENILCTAHSVRKHPKQLLLELLSRFSRSSRANSPMISQMVTDAWRLALQTKKPILLPLYPCVSALRTQHLCDRSGPTHILRVLLVHHSVAHVLVWGERYGVGVWTCDEDGAGLELEYLLSNQVISNFSLPSVHPFHICHTDHVCMQLCRLFSITK